MSQYDDDDDLTDIRQLPDLDEEQEDSFESLDDIAENLGFEAEDDDDDSESSSDDLDDENSFNELPDSPPDFNFDGGDTETPFESTEDMDESGDEEFTLQGDDEEEFQVTEEEEVDGEFQINDDFDDEESSITEQASDDFQPRTEFTLEEDLTPEPIAEEEVKKTPIPHTSHKEVPHSTPPEEFEEISNFAKNMGTQNFSTEGNPPFSIILKNIKYQEDARDIAELLGRFKLVPEDKLPETEKDMHKGAYLIPRLSEYSAILLCHKLRSFDLEILMGLTEEITPPKSYDSNDRGSTSKRTVLANKKYNFTKRSSLPFEEVLTTTLPSFNDYKIVNYIGIASESKVVGIDTLQKSEELETEILDQISESKKEEINLLRLKKENITAADSKFGFNFQELYGSDESNHQKLGLEHIYADLVINLKTQAKNANANAVVGINFSISPISIEEYMTHGPRYQILCTGNMVWIEKH